MRYLLVMLMLAGLVIASPMGGGTPMGGGCIKNGLVVVSKPNGRTIEYQQGLDTDAGRGAVLRSAISSATAGDIIYLQAASYAMGTSPLTFPSSVIIKGAGKYSTSITTSGTDLDIFVLSDGTVLEDLSITLNTTDSTQEIAIAQNATVRANNCYFVSGLDTFYLKNSGVTLYLTDCTFYGFFDHITSNTSCAVYAYNCDFVSEYSSSNPSTTTRCVGTADGTVGAIYNFYLCRFTARSSRSPASTSVVCVDVSRGGTVYLDYCVFSSSANETPASLYDVYGGSSYISNCRGSGTGGSLLTYGSNVVFTDNYTIDQAFNYRSNVYSSSNTWTPTQSRLNTFSTIPVGNLVAGTLSTIASGAVSASDIKISAIDGSAFIDFGSGVDLTENNDKYIIIKDSSGNYISGWIKTDGSGETLSGSELLSNPSFDTDVSGWAGSICTLASVAGGQSNNSLRVTRSSGTPPNTATSSVSLTAGKLYKLSIYVKGGTAISSAQSFSVPTKSISVTPTASWVQHSGYAVATTTGSQNFVISMFSSSPLGGTMYWDTASVQEVTAPSATGVTIVSSKGGTTYNWSNKHGSFNYNDTNGYTYSIHASSPGYVWLQPGTSVAGTSPIKFSPGTLNSLVEPGAMEYDGTNFYLSPNASRKTIQYKDDSPNISSGSSAPSTTPDKIGDIYIDTVSHKIYVADGVVNSSNWIIVN